MATRPRSTCLLLESLEDRLMMDSYFWLGTKDNFWSDPENWRIVELVNGKPNLKPAVHAPGINDDATFNNAAARFDVTIIGGAVKVKSLTVDKTWSEKGDIFVYSDLTANAIAFSKGRIGGPGTITINGSGTFSPGTVMYGFGETVVSAGRYLELDNARIDTRTLTNRGRVVLTGKTLSLHFASIQNMSGARFELGSAKIEDRSPLVANDRTNSLFINYGTVTAYSATINITFNNLGDFAAINAKKTTVAFNGGGVMAGNIVSRNTAISFTSRLAMPQPGEFVYTWQGGKVLGDGTASLYVGFANFIIEEATFDIDSRFVVDRITGMGKLTFLKKALIDEQSQWASGGSLLIGIHGYVTLGLDLTLSEWFIDNRGVFEISYQLTLDRCDISNIGSLRLLGTGSILGSGTLTNSGFIFKNGGKPDDPKSRSVLQLSSGLVHKSGLIWVYGGLLEIPEGVDIQGGRLNPGKGRLKIGIKEKGVNMNDGAFIGDGKGAEVVGDFNQSGGQLLPGDQGMIGSILFLTYEDPLLGRVGGNYFMSGGSLQVDISGQHKHAQPGRDYDQIVVSGNVSLAGELQINAVPGFVGNEFILIDNQGQQAVEGYFDGLPEGADLLLDGQLFRITYTGGDGNDVELLRLNAGIEVSVADAVITEGNAGISELRFQVRLNEPADRVVRVDYTTRDGTAHAGEDYQPVSGTLIFQRGEQVKDIVVSVFGDARAEADETINLLLTRTNHGLLLDRLAIGTVVNDDHVPIALDDRASTLDGTLVQIAVLANDTDVDHDTLSVTGISSAGHGTVNINQDGTLSYQPDLDFAGIDSFTYTVSDGANSAEANVFVTVTPRNQDILLVSGDLGTSTVVDFSWTFREAGYNNELFYFVVDDAAGRIDGLLPGDSGYAEAALLRALSDGGLGGIIFPSGAGAGARSSVTLPAGTLISFGFVQNSTLASLADLNLDNQLAIKPHAFFALEAANPDFYDHFLRNLNEFQVEDLDGGGDQDFNDIIFAVDQQVAAD